jgi:hypothetical protein
MHCVVGCVTINASVQCKSAHEAANWRVRYGKAEDDEARGMRRRLKKNSGLYSRQDAEVRDLTTKIRALSFEKNLACVFVDLAEHDLEMKLAVYSEMNELQAEHAKGALETIRTHLHWKISLFFRKMHTYCFCSQ